MWIVGGLILAFLVLAGFLGVFKKRRKKTREPEILPPRFVPHWFMMATVIFLCVSILLIVILDFIF